MKRFFCMPLLFAVAVIAGAQQVYTLDECRSMAMSNNKEVRIAKEKTVAARYEKKEAFTKFFPSISATGTYMRTQKEISLLSDEQKEGLNTMGDKPAQVVGQAITSLVTAFPELAPLLTPLAQIDLAGALNSVGHSITDAFRTDTRNLFGATFTLTQPIYMGGKIMAYNKITKYADQVARLQYKTTEQDVILSTDQAYWQVVSLVSKKKLAEGYLELLRRMDGDVEKMVAEGVATKADGLSVRVKVNEAEMQLAQVENGLTLSRMLLCQVCGLDMDTSFTLADEDIETLDVSPAAEHVSLEEALNLRPEIGSLTLAKDIYRQKVNIARSEFLPSVAVTANYLLTSPSLYNGFEKKVRGMWGVGAVVSIPLCNWGGGIYKMKAAKSQALIAEYKLEDAKEKIELQINQAAFKSDESRKKLVMAKSNLENAVENLRYANVGFKEGVIPASNDLEAHTAWLKANSEYIDAQIDVKMNDLYLRRALGTLGYEQQ